MSNAAALVVVLVALYAICGILFGGACVAVLSDWYPRQGELSDERAFVCWLLWPTLVVLVVALAVGRALLWLYRVPGRMFRTAARG
jgi:hypothetical protein